MTLKNLLFISILIFPKFIFSQNNFIITGKVNDKNNKPIENVKISLLKNDSSFVANSFSDKKGFYKITYNGNVVALIKAELQGFVSETKLLSNNSKIDFTLFETMNKNLKEVSVTAKKPIVEYKADKTIFQCGE